jgi:YD repeat-containing protein
VLNDTNSGYEYDAEGRQTGSYNQLNGLTGYIYDAEGRRVEKVLVNHFGTPQATTTVENEYRIRQSNTPVFVEWICDGLGA